MDDESSGDIERRLASFSSPHAQTELRAAVLSDIHRELAAARWDRRLARAAAVLLAVGVGMNLAMGLQSSGSSSAVRRVAAGPSRDSLVQVAVTVAEATDAETGSRFARQLAAISGLLLSSEQSAAIDAAVKLHARPAAANGKDG
jgi:hypothetical protein